MGATVCSAVVADKNLELVAAVDTASAGSVVNGIAVSSELRALADAKVDVAVDFTVAAASRINLPWLAMHNIHAVVGTTGFTDQDIEDFKKMFSSSNCIVAPNFAIGAVLMMRFAEIAAPFFETAEIIEIHHDGKADHLRARRSQRQSAWRVQATRGLKIQPSMRRLLGARRQRSGRYSDSRSSNAWRRSQSRSCAWHSRSDTDHSARHHRPSKFYAWCRFGMQKNCRAQGFYPRARQVLESKRKFLALNQSAQRIDCSVVIRFAGDLANQLGVQHFAFFVGDDDCSRQDTFKYAVVRLTRTRTKI